MAFKPLKLLGKIAGALIPGVGVVGKILAPNNSPEQVKDGLSLLDPIAQYNRTMARPRIAIAIVFTYLGGIIIQWVQVLFKIHQAYRVEIPGDLTEFAKIVVGVIVGTRGIEKIVGQIFKGKKK